MSTTDAARITLNDVALRDISMACARAAAAAIDEAIEYRLPLLSDAPTPPEIDEIRRRAGREVAAEACARIVRRRSQPLRRRVAKAVLNETAAEETAAFREALSRALARTAPPAAARTTGGDHARD